MRRQIVASNMEGERGSKEEGVFFHYQREILVRVYLQKKCLRR